MLTRAKTLIESTRAQVRGHYGHEVGLPIDAVTTPALILDLPAATRNVARMAEELELLEAGIRPHIKVHRSPDLAKLQFDHGVIGLSVATVWEAAIMAAASFDDIFVVNTVAGRAQMRALVQLAADRHVMIAIDDRAIAETLSELATSEGVTIGAVMEIDTGMDRAGVDDPLAARELARSLVDLPDLRFEGITGYEGHCSGVVNQTERSALHREAMNYFAHVADLLEEDGIPVEIRSAGGTTTWRWTASFPGITEIQAGSYVLMDNFHGRMVDDFEQALSVATTVTSRSSDRVIVDAGNKSVAVPNLASLKGSALPNVRFDEEHGVFGVVPGDRTRVGDRFEVIPGYAPSTVNLYDAYHVAEDGIVVDIWPVVPRGPGHHGLTTEGDEGSRRR